ncbi:YdcF family protein [Acidiferrobacter sp.]|uniref:YdcF family protein n=1 Tax=Acidiferrobacter sp. TaxID=1872107 RepID=UPI00260F38EB|nr:YdcF family protein [Acidiferrobacter sp.]
MILWHSVVNAFVTPPGLFLLLMVVGLVLFMARQKKTGAAVMVLSWAGLCAVSLPAVSVPLARAWERYPALRRPLPIGPQAIVVLAAGRYHHAPEYGGQDTVGANTLVRLRYAARLFRETHLPILVSGGAPLGGIAAARLMRRVLKRDFAVPVRWVEVSSRTTAQNARYSAAVLRSQKISTIFLVTQAWHMPRAVALFRAAGFKVVPAPTGFTTRSRRDRTVLRYLPSAHALFLSALIFHESVGLAWVHVQALIPTSVAHFISHG